MIFRLDFKIYTKIKRKSTIKYQEENFKEISVASSFRNLNKIFEKIQEKIFSFMFGKFIELTLILEFRDFSRFFLIQA